MLIIILLPFYQDRYELVGNILLGFHGDADAHTPLQAAQKKNQDV